MLKISMINFMILWFIDKKATLLSGFFVSILCVILHTLNEYLSGLFGLGYNCIHNRFHQAILYNIVQIQPQILHLISCYKYTFY